MKTASVRDVYDWLNQIAPFDMAEAYDNAGLLLGSMSAPAERILVALDATPAVIDEAIAHQAQLIVTHHPLMFHAAKNLLEDDYEGHVIRTLIQHNISLIAAHTNLDQSPVYSGSDKWLKRRDIRLIRRMLRDYQFRNSSLENTLQMWPQVVRGENLYMFPYVDTADAVIDTTHAYEPCVLGAALLPLLRQVPAGCPGRETVDRLADALPAFLPLPAESVPETSLLREFLGGWLYA